MGSVSYEFVDAITGNKDYEEEDDNSEWGFPLW